MAMRVFKYKFVPRWVIQLIDCIIISVCFAAAYFLTNRFDFTVINRGDFLLCTGLFCVVSALIFYLMRIHTGLIRYSNVKDIFRIFLAVLVSSLVYLFVEKVLLEALYGFGDLELGYVLFINFFITSSSLIILRTSVKETFLYAQRTARGKKERVLIYGADMNSILLKNALESAKFGGYHVFGFLDKMGNKSNSSIEQKRIFRLSDLGEVKNKFQIDKIVLLNEQQYHQDKKFLIERCLQLGIKVMTVPASDQWAHGKLSLNQIKDVNIEDLLQREPIAINNALISREIFGKRILITGAAGSIGAELVRQIIRYDPQTIILCDQAETPLYELHLEIKEKFPHAAVHIFIGGVQNVHRMRTLFTEFKPQIIFHAAAYKHVPLMEENPSEAILTNVLGTKNLADLAAVYNVEKFIMISTDKAVKPTNVMGASKRIAEMYIQTVNHKPGHSAALTTSDSHLSKRITSGHTKFITTRFGNVLGSNGSVLPLFTRQIQAGGPVTVTHPEITRYFMTIPEAVQLVLEAATMGQGGEIFIFDMGKPVKILDLAIQMIKLAGLEPDKDIKVEFTGLRAGEKLYEELLNDAEKIRPTHHDKIKIAQVISHNHGQVLRYILELIYLANSSDDIFIVGKMKELVTEFISNNSRFESLDGARSNADIPAGKEALKRDQILYPSMAS